MNGRRLGLRFSLKVVDARLTICADTARGHEERIYDLVVVDETVRVQVGHDHWTAEEARCRRRADLAAEGWREPKN